MHLTYLFKNTRFELNLFPKKKKKYFITREKTRDTLWGEYNCVKKWKIGKFPGEKFVNRRGRLQGERKLRGNFRGKRSEGAR